MSEGITYIDIDDKTYWSCGCVTYVVDEKFIIEPCSENCPVLIEVTKQSHEAGNPIQHWKKEDWLKDHDGQHG